MKSSKAKAYHLTAATAQHYPANAHTHVDLRLPLPTKSRGRRRIDPLAGVWDDEVVPMLRVAPGLRPIVVFRKISHRDRTRYPPYPGATNSSLAGFERSQSGSDVLAGTFAGPVVFDTSIGVRFVEVGASRHAQAIRPACPSQNPCFNL